MINFTIFSIIKKQILCLKKSYLLWFLLLFTYSREALAQWTPVPGTDLAQEVDKMSNFIHTLSLIFGALIIGAFFLFAILYRRRPTREEGTANVHHNLALEIIWSTIPFFIFIFMFAWGWVVYKDMRTPQKNELEIHAYGQMWNWDFAYKSGKKQAGALYVPINRPIKLILSSRDVIHSFFILAFRIKQDVIPGRYTSLRFTAKKLGAFNIFCTEFCGAGHYNMLAKLHVMKVKDWEKWMETDPYEGLSMVEVGKKVFQGRCTACHTTGTQKMIGPGLKGLYGSLRKFEKQEALTVDENYIRESILNPSSRIVIGYPNQMTPFSGLLQEEEMTGLVEYIKSLK